MVTESARQSSARSKGPAIMFFGGAFAVLMFAILTVVNASAWFNYVSAAVFLALAITLAYRGVWLLLHSRVAASSKR